MKTLTLSAIALLISIGCRTVQAESAQDMLPQCIGLAKADAAIVKSLLSDSKIETGICWGAFQVLQKLPSYIDINNKPMGHFCPPKGANRVQLISVFVKYAESHPELLHLDFTSVALLSLQGAFPCSRD